MKVNALNLAKYILAEYSDTPISPMKLQKLAYYSKVWSIIAGNNFIKADFERWEHGPVNREIFREYRNYSKNYIPPETEDKKRLLTKKQRELVQFVLQSYIDLSATALSIQTHKEDPWIETEPNGVITKESIKRYYSKQNFAKNFERKNYKKGPFYVLKTNSWYSFTMDMEEKEAEMYESYPSWEEYIEKVEAAGADFNNFFDDIISATKIN